MKKKCASADKSRNVHVVYALTTEKSKFIIVC